MIYVSLRPEWPADDVVYFLVLTQRPQANVAKFGEQAGRAGGPPRTVAAISDWTDELYAARHQYAKTHAYTALVDFHVSLPLQEALEAAEACKTADAKGLQELLKAYQDYEDPSRISVYFGGHTTREESASSRTRSGVWQAAGLQGSIWQTSARLVDGGCTWWSC